MYIGKSILLCVMQCDREKYVCSTHILPILSTLLFSRRLDKYTILQPTKYSFYIRHPKDYIVYADNQHRATTYTETTIRRRNKGFFSI